MSQKIGLMYYATCYIIAYHERYTEISAEIDQRNCEINRQSIDKDRFILTMRDLE